MIPQRYIIEWANYVSWSEPRQVEQDLIITRALLDLYSDPLIRKSLAFRGGTALNKIVFNPPSRYSEDIDLVQILPEGIGPTINRIQDILEPWLGKPKNKDFSAICSVLYYKTISEDGFPIKIKVEINTREHLCIMGFKEYPFKSISSWAPGNALITSYAIEELLGTKMRALYQRRKGRDLYDLYVALTTLDNLDIKAMVHCFGEYTSDQSQRISKKNFLTNMDQKLKSEIFLKDIKPLLPYNVNFDSNTAYNIVREQLIEYL